MARSTSKGIEALKLLAGGLLATAAGSSRGLSVVIKEIAKQTKLTEQQARSWLNHALKNQWVIYKETSEGFKLALSDKGRVKWQTIQLDQPLPKTRWDGRWRLVMFDIPSKQKKARDALRRKLQQLGLLQLQESVWITPYPCRDHIRLVSDLYGVDEYIYMVEAGRFEGDHSFVSKFDLL